MFDEIWAGAGALKDTVIGAATDGIEWMMGDGRAATTDMMEEHLPPAIGKTTDAMEKAAALRDKAVEKTVNLAEQVRDKGLNATASEQAKKFALGAPTYPKAERLGISRYPYNLQENSRWMKFSSFQYRAELARPGAGKTSTPINTIWDCYLPVPVITEQESHSYDQYHNTGAGIGASKLGDALANGDLEKLGAGGFDAIKGIGMLGAWNLAQNRMGNEFNFMRRELLGGKIIDPRNSIMYQGTALKQYQFEYYLVARNEVESMIIDNIVQSFRRLARPTAMGGIAGIDFPFLSHPNLWNLSIFDETK